MGLPDESCEMLRGASLGECLAMAWIAVGAVIACCAVFPWFRENNPIQGFAVGAILGIGIYAGLIWFVGRLY